MSEDLNLWEYWKDKRGSPSEAIEADYPNLLMSNWQLQMAVVQINSAQNMIDMFMNNLIGEADKDATTGTDEKLTYSLYG